MAKRRKSRAPRPVQRTSAAPPGVSLLYVESSALLAALLEGDTAARQALEDAGTLVTSALTFAEANRALARARATGRIDAEGERNGLQHLQQLEKRHNVVSVTDAVLQRAGRPYPAEPIRTLDAIHLATAELLGEAPQLVTILTRDVRVADNARALGYPVI